MAFLSLRRKIFFSLIATTLVFALGMVVFAHTVVRGRLAALLQAKGVAVAQHVAADCVSPVITESFFTIELLLHDLQAGDQNILYAFVLDEAGQPVAHTFEGDVPSALVQAHPLAPQQRFTTLRLTSDQGPVLDISVPLLHGQAGALRLGLSELPIQQDVNHIVWLILGTAVASLVLGGLVAAIFAHLITRPLLTLTRATEAFDLGRPNHPVTVQSDDEVGELAKVFNRMVENRQRTEEEREELIEELQQALDEVRTLRGILPICAACKKIRTDEGSWQQIEVYLSDHSDAEFSHGICPECAQRLYPEQWEAITRAKKT